MTDKNNQCAVCGNSFEINEGRCTNCDWDNRPVIGCSGADALRQIEKELEQTRSQWQHRSENYEKQTSAHVNIVSEDPVPLEEESNNSIFDWIAFGVFGGIATGVICYFGDYTINGIPAFLTGMIEGAGAILSFWIFEWLLQYVLGRHPDRKKRAIFMIFLIFCVIGLISLSLVLSGISIYIELLVGTILIVILFQAIYMVFTGKKLLDVL